jgi:hypothetical protein
MQKSKVALASARLHESMHASHDGHDEPTPALYGSYCADVKVFPAGFEQNHPLE